MIVDKSVDCRVCCGKAVPALINRPDREYRVAARLDYWHCTICGLMFADPIPTEMIPSFYSAYSTHDRSDSISRSRVWTLIDAISPAPDRAGAFASLNIPKDSRVLDFGCGDGVFLDMLQREGFTNLTGCDFDQNVAAAAMSNLRFFTNLDEIGNELFDVITLNHVLEHVEDVAETIKKLRLCLSLEGFIYIRTPNARSLLAGVFRSNWRGWETPRHLNIVTPRALRLAIDQAGGESVMLVTSNDMCAGILIGSIGIALRGLPAKLRNLVGIAVYVPVSWLLKAARIIAPMSAEEIVSIVR